MASRPIVPICCTRFYTEKQFSIDYHFIHEGRLPYAVVVSPARQLRKPLYTLVVLDWILAFFPKQTQAK